MAAAGKELPPPTPLPEIKRRMGEMYDAWQRGDVGQRVSLGLIGPEEATRIKAATGLDTLLNPRELDTGQIKHAFKYHGQEKKIGQISVTREDFERYAEILIEPHWIERGSNKDSVRFFRRYSDGTIYAAEQYVREEGKMFFRSMWKAALGGTMMPILIAVPEADEE